MDIRARPCMCALAAAGVVMLSEANERHDAPSASPELYAPNVISTADNELNSAFTPDGRTLYFTRKAGADGPIVSPDGTYLYFTSQRGFSDSAQQRALTYRELRDSLRSVRNGFGNIYRVPIGPVLAQALAPH